MTSAMHGLYHVLTGSLPSYPKAPCTHIVGTLALKGSLYGYFKGVPSIWVHGAFGLCLLRHSTQKAKALGSSGVRRNFVTKLNP